jgi:hypothetical protein
MNTSIRDEWTVRDIDQSTPLLKKAIDIMEKEEVRPRQVINKLGLILVILTIGFLSLSATLITIRIGVFATADSQVLGGLLVLLTLTIIGVSIFGLVLSLWNALVSTYLQSEAWRFEAAEATDQVHIIVESVAAAAAVTTVTASAAVVKPTSTVNEVIVQAVNKALAKAGPAEKAEMVNAFREVVSDIGNNQVNQ